MKTLEATKAADDFNRFLDQVSLRRESFRIVKKGVPCAYLIPADERGCNTHELAEELAADELSLEDRRALGAALRRARRVLRPPKNPWA
jgi:PHD/YefM family antitoxin component YafN of YafNO toxin-antitoxin module